MTMPSFGEIWVVPILGVGIAIMVDDCVWLFGVLATGTGIWGAQLVIDKMNIKNIVEQTQ
jgi:hypothetical protein